MEESAPAPRIGLARLADNIMGAMMAAMFVTFILQIITRYLAKYKIVVGDFIWTQDLSQALMVWIVFFGGAFALAESDHVKFDMIYNLFPRGVRRILAILAALAIVIFFAWSLPAALQSWLGTLWRWNKPNPTLKIPFSGVAVPIWAVYSIYAVFTVAIIGRYAWRIVDLLRGGAPDALDEQLATDAAATAAAERTS